MTNSSPEEQIAVTLACEYAEKINQWESAFSEAWSNAESLYIHDDPEAMQAYASQSHAVRDFYWSQYKALFAQYCTSRKRVYGGPDGGISAGFPTKFDGINRDSPASATQKNKSRIEVLFESVQQANGMQYDYLFVLLKKAGEWKIDSFKTRLPEEERWDNGIL